jgi:hypothetical protein
VTPVLAATASEQAELIVFIVLAPLAVVTALGMVLSRNAVYSALLLVVNFFCLAGFYVLDVASEERAVEIAAKVPEAALGLVEVRPTRSLDPTEW